MVKRQSKSRLQLYNEQSIGDERAKRIKEIEETYDLKVRAKTNNIFSMQKLVDEKAELLGYVREGNYFVKDGIYKDAYEYTFDNDGEVIPLSKKYSIRW